jgi:hypothetical protein
MAKINIDESIISTLVNETYNISGDESLGSKHDLSTYFEIKSGNQVKVNNHLLEDILIRNSVSFSLVQYSQKTSCFHFELKGKVFSCPRNWGCFSKLHREMDLEGYQIMEEFNSELFFDEIFSSSVQYEYEATCFFGNSECYLIFLPKGKSEVINWLKKYCETDEMAA